MPFQAMGPEALIVVDAETDSFIILAELLGYGRDFRNADLSIVDFADDDVADLDVRGADLSGANLTRARNTDRLIWDDATKWPADFHPKAPPFWEAAIEAGIQEILALLPQQRRRSLVNVIRAVFIPPVPILEKNGDARAAFHKVDMARQCLQLPPGAKTEQNIVSACQILLDASAYFSGLPKAKLMIAVGKCYVLSGDRQKASDMTEAAWDLLHVFFVDLKSRTQAERKAAQGLAAAGSGGSATWTGLFDEVKAIAEFANAHDTASRHSWRALVMPKGLFGTGSLEEN